MSKKGGKPGKSRYLAVFIILLILILILLLCRSMMTELLEELFKPISTCEGMNPLA